MDTITYGKWIVLSCLYGHLHHGTVHEDVGKAQTYYTMDTKGSHKGENG